MGHHSQKFFIFFSSISIYLLNASFFLNSDSLMGQKLVEYTGCTSSVNITYSIDNNGEVWSWGGYHAIEYYETNTWALGRNFVYNNSDLKYGGSYSLPGKVLKGDYEASNESINYLGENLNNPIVKIVSSLGNKGNNVVFISNNGEVFYMGTNPDDFIDVDETNFKKLPNNIWSLTDVETHGKVIDAALDHNTMIIITDTGKIFARGYFKDTTKSIFNVYTNESNLVDWGNDNPTNQASFREIKNIEPTLSGDPIQVESSGNYPTTSTTRTDSKHSYFIRYNDGKLGFLGALRNKNNNLEFNPFPGYDSKYIYGIKAIIDSNSNVLDDVELLTASHNSVMIKRSDDESLWFAGRNIITSGDSRTNFTKVLNDDSSAFDAANIFKIDNTSFEFYAASSSGIYRWGQSNGSNDNDFDISHPSLVPKGDYPGTSYIGDNPNDPILDFFVGDETLIVLTDLEKKLYALGMNNYHQLSICPTLGPNSNLDWWSADKVAEPVKIISSISINSGNTRIVDDCPEIFSLNIDYPPTVVSIVTNDSDDKLKDTDVVRVTATFSEAMTASPTISIDLPNGTDISAVSMTQSTTADVWYYDWTVADGGDGSVTITVSGSDLAGNAYAGSDTKIVAIDNTAPTLTITAADTSLIVGETAEITFTFSEDILGFETADISLEGGGSLSGISATSSQVFTATYTPPAATTGTVTLTVGVIAFEDIVGNDNTTTATLAINVDTEIPTLSSVSIVSNNSDSSLAKPGDEITLSFTSSEAIQSPTVTVDGNAATISGGGTSWTAAYTFVSGDTEGVLSFTIDFQDTAGNSGTQVTAVTDSSSVTFDETVPTVVSIVTNDSDDKLKDTDVVRVTATFSEAMTASPTISIDLPNGTDISAVSMTQSTTADVWYYDWTVADGGDGSVTITVSGSDLAGNAYAGSDTKIVAIDNTAPTLTITAADTSLIVGETAEITFTFSEDILGFETADISLEGGGSLSGISATSSQVFTATYTPPAATTGTVTLTVGVIAFEDIVGNDNTTTATLAINVDTEIPTLSSVSIVSNNSDSSLAKPGDEITLSFTSSEAIQSPTVTVDGNAATISGGGTSWTAAYTFVSGDTEGVLSFTIDFQDTAGNSGTQVTAVTDSSSVTFDETVPTVVSIVTNDSDDKLKDTDVVRVTATFSEAMTASPTISIDLPNGTDISAVSMTQSTTADVWYYDWTVADGGDGSVTITVSGSDLAGNAYAGSDTKIVAIDNTAPTLTITAADTSLIVGETAEITFTFSEDILGFETADISLEGGGSLSGISATSSQVFTATYTPPAATTGTVTLTVGVIAFEDIVGNDNTTTATLAINVDTEIPTLSSVSIVSNNSDSSLAKPGDEITLSFTSSEAIQSPTVTVDGNAATISGGGTSWTAAYTFVSGDTEGVLSFTIDFQDTAGNSGTQVTAVTDSSSVTFDETVPTVVSIVTNDSDDKLKDTDVVRVTATFSEAMTASPTISIDLPNGTDISAVSMTQSTTADVWYYDWTVADGGDGSVTITVSGSDLAGNAYAGSDTKIVAIDNTAPTLTITAADTSLIVGETAEITFTFSEDILGFETADISLEGGGSLSGISATSSQVFTATYTPPAATTGTVTLTVGVIAFEDIVGNDNTTTATLAINVDTEIPVTESLDWLDVSNLRLNIRFSQDVFNSPSGSGDLEITDFNISIIGSGFSNPSITSISKSDDSNYELSLSVNGTAAGDESFIIIPNTNSIFDNSGNSMSTAQVVKSIQYNLKPVFPDASNIEVSVAEGSSVSLPISSRLNATDTDGPSDIVYNIGTLPTVGSLSISQTLTGDITYTHDGSEVKTDQTTLVAYDGASDSDPIQINITITNVNDLPVVSNIPGSFTTLEDTLSNLDLSSISIEDVDVFPSDTLSFTLRVIEGSLSATGTASITVSQTQSSSIILSGTASDLTDYLDTISNIKYLSALNAQGLNKDTLSYVVNDNAGSQDMAIENSTQIDITNTNDAPQGVSQSYQGNLGNGVITSGTLSGTDIDPSETLTFTLVDNPSYGSVVVNSDGSFVYTHDGSAVASDFFTFNVNDGEVTSAQTATATLSFNQSPVLPNQTLNVQENGSASLTPIYTDNENDAVSQYYLITQPTYGQVIIQSAGYSYLHDGTNAVPEDSFTIKINDGYTDSNVATVTVNVAPVNDPPIASNISFNVNEGGSVVFNLSATDEEGEDLVFSNLTNPINGTATLNGTQVTYTHDGTETTSDEFTFEVSDGVNTTMGSIIGSITLVNDPPLSLDQTIYVHEREFIDFNLEAFDEESDPIITYNIVASPLHGTLDNDGSSQVTYTPNVNSLGEIVPDNAYSFVYKDEFTFNVKGASVFSNNAKVTVLVIPYDHDRDGVPTKTENLNANSDYNDDDTDADGTPNYLDTDDDNDTIPTIFENFFATIYNGDSDSDGILNYLDEDDDNDGVLTKYETAFNPFVNSGKSSNKVRHKKSWDYNPKRWSIGSSAKGRTLSSKEDEVEYPDTDGDGIPDFADIDDDGDGVLTAYEVPDTNNDGNPVDALDSDQESVPNYLDVDDDDDGVSTKYEIPDQNGDGVPDDALDSDNEQIPNYLDVDDDNDSILTFFELPDQNGDGVPDDALDSDQEQIPNYLDVDDDNDSIPTINEIPDQDGDGVPDDPLNSDNEDTPNYIDVDDDNDNILTIEEDEDGDGNPLNNDRDGDGLIDAFESRLADKDEDGVSDEYDSENENPNNDQDGDGFGNLDETICGFNPLDPNEYPADIDADGIVNCIDDDIDGDGVSNEQDAFPENPFESVDTDGDGIGEIADIKDDRVYPVKISGVLTPNSGSSESVWLITNIDKYPGNRVVVYNKNGQEVFRATNYKNDWRGNYKGNNEPLPAGTYYYIVHVSPGDVRKGWLYITY